MKEYFVVVWWSEAAICKVKAESLEMAREKVRNDPDTYVPEHGDYVDDSLTIDYDQTAEFNEYD